MGAKPRRRKPTLGEEIHLEVADRLVRDLINKTEHPVTKAANERITELIDKELESVPLREITNQGLALNQSWWEKRQRPKSRYKMIELQPAFDTTDTTEHVIKVEIARKDGAPVSAMRIADYKLQRIMRKSLKGVMQLDLQILFKD